MDRILFLRTTLLVVSLFVPDFLRGQDLDHLPPVDESAKDPTFAAFRRNLLAALNRKDVRYLLSITASDIKSSFGGDDGRADFRKFWKLDRPQRSSVWHELRSALELGCVGYTGGFACPYVFARFPEERDSFGSVAVIRPDARLYAEPNERSKVLEELHWDILEVPEYPGDGALWWHVKTVRGTVGFARATDIRSPVGYRAIFLKRAGRWTMTMLVAGD